MEVLDKQVKAGFQQGLFNTLTHYYKEILSVSGAGGRPKPKHFKCLMHDEMDTAGGMTAGGCKSSVTDPPLAAAEAASAAAPANAVVDAASALAEEAPAAASSIPP